MNNTFNESNIVIIKKNGSHEKWNSEKILRAVGKSANRVLVTFTEEEQEKILTLVKEKLAKLNKNKIAIFEMHSAVEYALNNVNEEVAKAYKDFRNYKTEIGEMMDLVQTEENRIRYIGDKSNANKDAKLVATKRSLIYGEYSTLSFEKFHLTKEERQAARDGYIYIHDKDSRKDTMNCFSRDTRFITDRGVRSFYDFCEGEEIKVLTHKGNWKKAIVKSYGYQKLQKVTFKRAKGNKKEVFCTENHRWILKDGMETTSLSVGDKLIAAPNIADINWDLMNKSEKLLWCLGFGFADGSIVKDNELKIMHIRLCGDKVKYANRFEDVGYNVTYPESLSGDGMVRINHIHSKEIPWLILNHTNTKYFIDGWLCADGNAGAYKSNKYRGIQVTGNANDYIYDLLNVSGYYVTNKKDLTGQETNYGVRTEKTISYGFHSNQSDRTWVVESIEPAYVNGNAQVWCLEVEDDHSFVLENGIPTGNCCLFDMKKVLTGGFEMGNMWYNEPNTLDTGFDVMGDVILATAAQQYGGFTVPEVDTLLEPYAEKSYEIHFKNYIEVAKEAATLTDGKPNEYSMSLLYEKADEYAMRKLKRECEQGMQGIEYKLNTVGSSRGDYPEYQI